MRIGESNWIDIRDAIASGAAAIVPLGSTEEHGPHVPTGDYMVVDEIARRTALETGDLVAPTLPFGYSEYFRHYPGTLTLRPETLGAVIEDVVSSLTPHGVKRIVLFNGHSGNAPIIELVSRRIRRESGVFLVTLAPFEIMKAVAHEVYDGDVILSHGGEPMGSLMLALAPELVKLDRVGRETPVGIRESLCDYRRQGLHALLFEGIRVGAPIDVVEVADSDGRLGAAEGASRAKGEALLQRTVHICVAFMTSFRQMPDPPDMSPYAAKGTEWCPDN
jgi:creatinine amidohydrolase